MTRQKVQDGILLIAASTADGSLSNPSIVTADPGGGDGYIETHGYPLARILFGGSTTANQTVNYQVSAVPRVWKDGAGNGQMWVPKITAAGTYTLGATALPAWMYAANGLVADTITETVNCGAVVHSPADDSVAWLDVPTDGAQYLLIETDRGTAATADVIVQFGEEIGNSFSLEGDITLGAVDVTKVGGTAISVTSGNKDNGTQRVILADDDPAVALLDDLDVTKLGGIAIALNAGAVNTGTQRVTLPSDDPAVAEMQTNNAVLKGDAVASSGQHLDNAGSGTAATTNYTVTVVALATYRVTAVNGVMYLGIADSTSDANVLWAVPAGTSAVITIPSGTSLHYSTASAGVEGRLSRMF